MKKRLRELGLFNLEKRKLLQLPTDMERVFLEAKYSILEFILPVTGNQSLIIKNS